MNLENKALTIKNVKDQSYEKHDPFAIMSQFLTEYA
jgi:hypothetical protein